MKGTAIRNLPFPEIGSIYPDRSSVWGASLRFDIADEEEDVQAIIDETFPRSIKKITVMLPHRTLEENYQQRYIARQNNLTIAISDGKIMLHWLDTKSCSLIVSGGVAMDDYPSLGITEGQQVPYRDIIGFDEDGNAIKLQPYGRLSVMLPELHRIAFLTLRLPDMKDQLSIQQEIYNIYNSTWGDLRKIPIDIFWGYNYFMTKHGIRKRTALTATVPDYFVDDVFDRKIFNEHELLTQQYGAGKFL